MTLLDLSISEAGARLRDGTLTSVDLTEAHLDIIFRSNPVIHAFLEVTTEELSRLQLKPTGASIRASMPGPSRAFPSP